MLNVGSKGCHVYQEAGPEGGKIQMHFEEMLKSNTSIYVVIISWYLVKRT